MDEEKKKYVKKIYYNLKKGGSYGGVDKLYRQIKDEGKYSISKGWVKKWLSSQRTYTQNRSVIRKFKTAKLISPYINYQWDTDTASYTYLAKYNKGYKYFVVFIDYLSRYLYTKPLKTLKALEMKKAMQDIFKQASPRVLRSDGGSEFNNKIIESYLEQEGIKHIVTKNQTKASLAERGIKHVRSKLAKYMHYTNSYSWVDHLDDVTRSINNTYHRVLKMTPAQASKENSDKLWMIQHSLKKTSKIKIKKTGKPPYSKSPFKFKVNDRVQISRIKGLFDREVDTKFTDEIFTIISRKLNQNFPKYEIKDQISQIIQGRFYEKELVKVGDDADENNGQNVYKIEKILKTQKKGSKLMYLIKWQNYNKSFNSWVDDADIKDL